MMHILNPIPPYNFPLMLNLLARYHLAVDHVRDSGREYRRVLRLGEKLVLVRVMDVGTVDTPKLEVYLTPPPSPLPASGEGEKNSPVLSNVYHEQLLEKIQYMLSLEVDPRPFYAFAEHDPLLWAVMQPLLGIRYIRTESAFEALVTAILEQQISLRGAHKALKWLVEWAGDGVMYEGEMLYAFPTPAQIAGATIDDLRPLKITFRRMQLLINVAQKVVNGELPLEAVCKMPSREAYQILTSIKGIGHWTAAVTLIKCAGDFDHVLHNDVGLQAAVNTSYFNLPGRATPQTVMDVFAQYGDYAGLAAYYILSRRVLDFF